MSIWCTWREIGDREEHPDAGHVLSYAEGWSNHYPTDDGMVEQPASVGIAHIPTWCTPGYEDEEYDSDAPFGEWVRLDVVGRKGYGHAAPARCLSVVLDEAAARALAADLLAWADTEKVYAVREEAS